MEIKEYTVEQLKDPFNLLVGERYEFILDLEVPEDDELYSETGVQLRVIFAKIEQESRILQYNFIEKGSEKVLDFELEDEEEELIVNFCLEQLPIEK